MAGKKTYVVVKNGVEIQRLNTLIAARKLADEEGAEVFCDGLSIYKAVEEIVHVEPIVAEEPKQIEVEEPKTEKYRLKALMNIRKKPSLDSEILGTKPAGTVVRVLKVEEGWLHLIDGSYILFEDGRYSEKLSGRYPRMIEV